MRPACAVELLRVSMGLIWTANLLFVVLPSAEYWNRFSDTARGYGPTSLGGPGVADYIAAHPEGFAWLIAIATAYLAVAFLFGVTTRLACIVGAVASVGFLLTQWGQTFAFPGGTDVGAHPLYLAAYAALFLGGGGARWSVDRWVWTTGRARWASVARWLATPRPAPPRSGDHGARAWSGGGSGSLHGNVALPPSSASRAG